MNNCVLLLTNLTFLVNQLETRMIGKEMDRYVLTVEEVVAESLEN